MKRLPDAELELMMIIWDSSQPVSRADIEKKMKKGRSVVPSAVLTLLSRLEKRGFIRREKRGKINYYYSVADKIFRKRGKVSWTECSEARSRILWQHCTRVNVWMKTK